MPPRRKTFNGAANALLVLTASYFGILIKIEIRNVQGARMPTNVYADETIVVPLLTRMRLPRWVLLDMGSKTAGERANVAPYEPAPVAGFETWRWATRFFREDRTLRENGWLSCDADQVSGIRNANLGIKLVACAADANTGNPERTPKNVTEKGPASCRLIGRNTGQMKLGFIHDEPKDDLWYYCIYISEQCVSIEISRPNSEIGGFISSFSDRIIIAQPGEIPGIRRVVVPEDFADVPKPQVSRKVG